MTFYPLAEYAWHYASGTFEFAMGRTRANSVCFTKNWVNIGDFPNLTSSSKFKFARGWKRSKVRSVGWGRQFFPKSPKESQKLLKMSTACLFKEIDAQLHSSHCLHRCFTQDFSLVMQVYVRPELKPKKKLSLPIFLVKIGPIKKNSLLCASAPPPPSPLTTGFPELYSSGYLILKKIEHQKNFEHFDETERKWLR